MRFQYHGEKRETEKEGEGERERDFNIFEIERKLLVAPAYDAARVTFIYARARVPPISFDFLGFAREAFDTVT